MSKRIIDAESRPWDVDINVLTLGRVRDEAKMNLLEIILPDNTTLGKLAEDPIDLARVLFLLCRDQIDEKHVPAEEFYRALSRDCLDDGLHAILEGVINFSPSGTRPAYQKVLEKAKKLNQLRIRQATEMVESPEFDAMLERTIRESLPPLESLQNVFTGDAGNSPAPSESSPDATPSQP